MRARAPVYACMHEGAGWLRGCARRRAADSGADLCEGGRGGGERGMAGGQGATGTTPSRCCRTRSSTPCPSGPSPRWPSSVLPRPPPHVPGPRPTPPPRLALVRGTRHVPADVARIACAEARYSGHVTPGQSRGGRRWPRQSHAVTRTGRSCAAAGEWTREGSDAGRGGGRRFDQGAGAGEGPCGG